MEKEIRVLILAGGDSSRLWPLSNKHFLNFLGKPLVYYPLRQLEKFGFREILVVFRRGTEVGWEKLKKFFPRLSLELIPQENFSGMAGAVLSAAKYIDSRPLLVVGPSDIYEDILLADFLKLLEKKPEGVLAGKKMETYFPGGYLVVEQGKIENFIEKPSPSQVPSQIVSFVFHYFREGAKLVKAIQKINRYGGEEVYEQAIFLLIKKGFIFQFLPYRGFFGYLKYPWHILDLSAYFLGKIKGRKIQKAYLSSSVVIQGEVFIEDDVEIRENVKIIGPTYIGKGTVIGNNCLVRESMIGENCLLGFSTEIARSYLGDNCWFHHNYIGDSVFAKNIHVGAGTITANFRLDEKTVKSMIDGRKFDTQRIKLGAIVGEDVHLGVNVSLMPGVKIGKGSFIAAGNVISSDVLEKIFYDRGQSKPVR